MEVTRLQILEVLHGIDTKLVSKQKIVLCGASSVILQGYDFRKTMDIDFAEFPTPEVAFAIQKFLMQSRLNSQIFDTQASGVIQLLDDYEKRLVPIHDNFKLLNVKVLSVMDWLVSKLNSPKIADTVNFNVVTIRDVNRAFKNMDKYCGLSTEQALLDLKLIGQYLKTGDKMPM